MSLRIHLIAAVMVGIAARGATAQAASQHTETGAAVGVWRGTSKCLVKPSACNDEIVVYRITQLKAADSVAVDARKIVRGEEQEMGVLRCRFARADGRLTCAMPQGIWHFHVGADSLTGELRLPDDTRFRDVRTIRAP